MALCALDHFCFISGHRASSNLHKTKMLHPKGEAFNLSGERGITKNVIPKGDPGQIKTLATLKSVAMFFIFKNAFKRKAWALFENKKPAIFIAGFPLRRKRDSNPRRCDPQQFSRLPHSTTLPFLRVSHQVFLDCGCKYRKLFQITTTFSVLFFIFLVINPASI